ncbi:MAG: hypothetical protein AAGD14_08080 [Planctomycetota bacterium]
MNDHLIDSLLGEGPEHVPASPDEVRLYREAIEVLRAASIEESQASLRTPAPTSHVLPMARRFAAVAAALALVAVGIFWMDRTTDVPARHFEPATAFGMLLPEELGADGSVYPAVTSDRFAVRSGEVVVAAIGAEQSHRLRAGDPLVADSEIRNLAEGGACLDMPGRGHVFLSPLAEVQLRQRKDGRVALRLLSGAAATYAGGQPIHLAVDGTDLLLTQHDGATLLRKQDADAICLWGRVELHVADGSRWRIPVGESLPAVCAEAPESMPAPPERLELDWYDELLGRQATRRTLPFDADGKVTESVTGAPNTLLYVRALAAESTELIVRYGNGAARTFPLRAGQTFELRLPLASLGTGESLQVQPAAAVRMLRLLTIAD